MQEIAIRINAISKCYHIYNKPQDRLKQSVIPRLRRLVGAKGRHFFREFWALRDVSLDVPKGETLGIIGRNGSGKSTLLQIVCGTLSPTSGDVEIKGRVAALLELGSGFNPEFTGRENIFMNGMVLGLTKEEVETRFDSIVAFADIDDFIGQPVKTYSSGMAVRLAFAVIAHVDADILVIDEALAVGDAVFTQKCMRFLRRFRENGTVLFVSHDAASIVNLCSEAVWLDGGRMRMRGPAKEVAEAYSRHCAQLVVGDTQTLVPLKDESMERPTSAQTVVVDTDSKVHFFDNIANSDGWTSGAASIISVDLAHAEGFRAPVFSGGERVKLTITAQTKECVVSPILGFFVKDRLGQSLFGEHTYNYVLTPLITRAGDILRAEFVFTLPMLPDGDYSITVSIAEGDPLTHIQHHWLHDAVIIKVSSTKLRYGLVGILFDRVEMSVVSNLEHTA